METTSSPFRQIIGYRIFFAFLVLFTMGVLVESVNDDVTDIVPVTPDTTLATNYEKQIGNDVTKDTLGMTTVAATGSASKLPFTTPSTKHSSSLLSSLPSKQPSVVTHVAPTHGKKTSALDVVTTTVSHIVKDPRHKLATNTSDLHTSADQKANVTQKGAAAPSSETSATPAVSSAGSVVQKAQWTSGELTTSNEITPAPKTLRPRSKGGPGQSTGKGQMTTPGQGVPDSTQRHGIAETLSTEARETGTTDTRLVSGTTAPSNTAEKTSVALIIAIALFFLLVLALLMACLYCRRRRRSGSTSFNSAGWAGQVALPDDTGLDKDEEQGPLATGEKEMRRPTLTTFFGKRQSRAPSVAMEEIERREETQQLIDGNAGRDSSPQGPGEANGKVPEPTQEEETPPTQVE